MFGSDRMIALDIGASKVVMAEFLVPRARPPQLLNYGIAPLGVEAGAEIDPSAYIATAVRDLMRRQRIRPGPMLMTVSGQAVFPRYVKLPPVTRDKVFQIVQYEAEQNVPFPIDEVVWDYQLISGAEDELNVMLVAVKIENVTKLTDAVQSVGLEPEIVDVAPMALYNTVRYNYPDLAECTMVLDMGARCSNLIFVEEHRIFSRSIPVAGHAMTQELMKEFDLSFEEAEELKHSRGLIGLGGVSTAGADETTERAAKVLRNVVTRLHAEVNRSINFYRSQQGGSPPARVLLTGGASILPHGDTFFRDKLHVPVEYLNPFVNVPVSTSIDAEAAGRDAHLLGEVVGLALRRSLSCPVEVNLMPPDLVAKKVFRKRQPFFVLAAAGVVLILLCWWVYFKRMETMLGSRVTDVQERIEGLRTVSAELEQVLKRRAAVRAQVENLVGLIGLRTRWTEILDGLHGCMLDGMWLTSLQPVVKDGRITHLTVAGRGFVDRLVDTPEASAAEIFRDRLTACPYFGEDTRITRLPPVSSEDFTRQFEVTVALREPMKVR